MVSVSMNFQHPPALPFGFSGDIDPAIRRWLQRCHRVGGVFVDHFLSCRSFFFKLTEKKTTLNIKKIAFLNKSPGLANKKWSKTWINDGIWSQLLVQQLVFCNGFPSQLWSTSQPCRWKVAWKAEANWSGRSTDGSNPKMGTSPGLFVSNKNDLNPNKVKKTWSNYNIHMWLCWFGFIV